MSANANLKADVELKPEKSHIFVNLLVCLAGLAFLAGFIFLWFKPESAWVGFALGTSLVVPAFFAWNISRKDIDLQKANATTIRSKKDGSLEVSTDIRTFFHPEVIDPLSKFLQTVAHRSPLPEPDGLVDKNGKPIPNTKNEAIRRVKKANDEALALAAKVVLPSTLIAPENLIQSPTLQLPEEMGKISKNLNKVNE